MLASGWILAWGFLNPMLLWAVPLAAVPIIIHLLNRRRFKTVRWAAMEYLLRAMKRNRRRIQMQQWLVLLLRVLGVLLLVFLCTRPQLTGGAFGAGVTTHHVLVLDDSASMARTAAASNVMEQARDTVRGLAADRSVVRDGDVVTLVASSDPESALLSQAPVGPELDRRVRAALARVQRTDGRIDAGAALAAAEQLGSLAEGAGHVAVHWISDFRQIDWLTEQGDPLPGVVDSIRGLAEPDRSLRVHSVGDASVDNVAVSAVTLASRLVAVGVPVDVDVLVVNRGTQTVQAVDVTLEIDRQTATTKVTDAIAPGQTATVRFKHTFRVPGDHGIQARIPRDRFALDDQRSLALTVADASRVLVVDGDPRERPRDAESHYLAAALEPGGDFATGLAVEIVGEDGLRDADLSAFDFVFLCNVAAPAEPVVERLEAWVRGGGGLWVWLGDQADPTRYNELLFKSGSGLLPVPLEAVDGDQDRPEHVFVSDPTHATVAEETEILEVIYARAVQVGRYFRVRPASDDARVVLRLRDSEGPPLLLSKLFGDGEVLLTTTTVDAQWTSWPREAAYQITVLEGHRGAMRAIDTARQNLGPAGTLQLELDPGRYRGDARIQPWVENSAARTVSARQPEADDPALMLSVPMVELDQLGLHDLHLIGHDGSETTRRFARNIALDEGRFAPMSRTLFRRAFPESVAERVEIRDRGEQAAGGASRSGEGETWRYLAFALVGVLLLESLLAWRFGRR